MEGDVGLFEALFYVSLTVNICSWLHFGLFSLMDLLVAAETRERVTRLRLAHKHNPTFMRNVYVDVVLFTTLPVTSIVLAFTTDALRSPFKANYPRELRVLFSAVCGVFVFLLFRVCLVARNSPAKYVHVIVYVVSLATAATVLFSGEDAAMGLVLSVSTGDVAPLNCGQLLEVARVRPGSPGRRAAAVVSAGACLLFRAALPLACLAAALANGRPFDMSYPSIFFFFVGILFFGAVNTWQVNAALCRLCRRRRASVVEVACRPKPEEEAVISGAAIEMPPSYAEVCGSASYLPVSLPAEAGGGATVRTGAGADADAEAPPDRGSGPGLMLTLDASALHEVSNVYDDVSLNELTITETTVDTVALL